MTNHTSAYAHVRVSPHVRRASIALVAAVAVLLGLAAPATATGAAAPTSAQGSSLRARGSGSVSGHVDTPDNEDRTVVFVRNHRTQRKIRVDGYGNYDARALPDGTYHVIFNRLSGQAFAAAQFYHGHDEYQGTQSADDVVVSGGAAVTGIDARLHRGGVIKGVLHDTRGAPLSRCTVQAFTPDGSLVTRASYTRLSDGSFEIGGLTTGAYRIRVMADKRSGEDSCGNGTQFLMHAAGGLLGGAAQAVPVRVVQGRTTTFTAPLRYTEGGQIAGHVTLPVGASDDDRRVTVRGAHGIVRGSRIDENGDYTVDHLRQGTYRVTFDRVSGQAFAAPLFYRHQFESQHNPGGLPATFTRVSVDSTGTTSLATAHLVQGASITGVVRDQFGTGLASCAVQAYTSGDRLVTRTAHTAANGSFSVTGLSTGRYLVRVLPRKAGGCNRGRQFYLGAGHLGGPAAAQRVRTTLGQRTPVGPLTYTRGADITGHVTFPSGYSRYTDTAVTVRDGHFARTVRTDRDGDYRVTGLPAGSYRVTFNRLSGFADAAAQFYRGHNESETVAAAERLTLALGQTLSGINARLRPGGHLTGKLVDRTGQPLHCVVQAFTTDGSRVSRDAYAYGFDGSFDIAGLTNGDYEVRVLPDQKGRNGCDQGLEYLGTTHALSNIGPGTPQRVEQGSSRSLGTLRYRPRTALVDATAPTISGHSVVGAVLTADPGSWTPVTPGSYLYAWFSAGVAVPGATGSTYQVQGTDLGNAITVQVTARRAGFTSGTATSAAVGPVTKGTLVLSRKPRIIGTRSVGHELSLTPATATPTPSRVHYQWLRNGIPIRSATQPAYPVVNADRGREVSVQITYLKPGYANLVVATTAVLIQ